MGGVNKKLAPPPVLCSPKALPLVAGGKSSEIKDVAGAWYVAASNPKAIIGLSETHANTC